MQDKVLLFSTLLYQQSTVQVAYTLHNAEIHCPYTDGYNFVYIRIGSRT